MLQKTKVVARKYFEKLYDCKCDIVEYQEMIKLNKSTGFGEVTTYQNQSCKISYETLSTINIVGDNGAEVPLSTKLFISPDIKIKTGSKIKVTNSLGEVIEYKSSGEPAMYDTHQEIMLELFESWS